MLTVDGLAARYGRVTALHSVSFEVSRGRDRGDRRPERRRQVDDAGGDHGHRAAGRRLDRATAARAWSGSRPSGSCGAASRSCPRAGRSSPRCRSPRTSQLGTTIRRDRAEAARDLERVLERFPILRTYYRSSAAKLSGGEQQQLAIARALLSRAEPAPARRALARARADHDRPGLRDPGRAAGGRRDHPARRAERDPRGRARRSELRAANRPRRALGHARRAAPDDRLRRRLPRRRPTTPRQKGGCDERAGDRDLPADAPRSAATTTTPARRISSGRSRRSRPTADAGREADRLRRDLPQRLRDERATRRATRSRRAPTTPGSRGSSRRPAPATCTSSWAPRRTRARSPARATTPRS